MTLMKISICFSIILISLNVKAQVPATKDTFPTSGVASIMSSKSALYQLSINGAVKQYGTGLSSVTSPTHFLQNTTASTGKQFGINASDAGALQIIDVTAASAIRFIISSGGNVGIGTASPLFNLDVTGTGRFTSSVTGNSFIKAGGTSTQFLKADGSVDGNSYLTSNQTITLSGDATGSGTTTIPLTLATVNSNVGSFSNPNITIDAKGRITAASNGSSTGITGTGTTNYLSKFTGGQVLGSSQIYDNGSFIGIGTSTPVSLFHCTGTVSIGTGNLPSSIGVMQFRGDGGSPIVNRLTFGTDGSGLKFAIGANQAGSLSDLLTVQDNGNVGIGTTTPSGILELATNGSGYTNNWKFNNGFLNQTPGVSIINNNSNGRAVSLVTGTNGSAFIFDDGGNFNIVTDNKTKFLNNTLGNGTMVMSIAPSGITTLPNLAGTNSRMVIADANGTLSTQTIPSSGVTSLGSTNYIQKVTGSNTLGNSLLYDNGSSIGIGTATPGAKLDVSGDALINTLTIGLGSGNIATNTVVGKQALNVNTTGYQNTAIGYQVMSSATLPTRNVAIGDLALSSMISGGTNIAIGHAAMASTSPTVHANVAIGANALQATGSNYNVGIGAYALNGTMPDLWTNGDNTGPGNVSVGAFSTYNGIVTGGYNTAIGYGALYNLGAGAKNTSLGFNAGSAITTGSNNILIGQSTITASSNQLTTGSNNISIGSDVALPNPTASNQLNIGNLIYGKGLDGTGSTISTGSIGIGTTNPGNFKLAVEGNIGARKITVTQTSPWPDYVFHKHYKLPTLEDIENYIKKNKHLPDVPSSDEVKKYGIDLGDNQALLLKKIEEMTLIIIEQNKRLNQQEKRLQLLEEKK